MFNKKISRRDFLKTMAMAAFAMAVPNFFSEEHVDAAKNCSVKLRQGIYNGFVDKRGVQTWLGIPYAKPPVGNLRWRAPEKLDASNKTFSAKKLGPSPMQIKDPNEAVSNLPQSEDCLTLNIWTRGTADKKPVMVYIPGGGFVGGGSGDPLYYGSALATHDVVVVTINYRLNIFGFMNFAAIDSNFADSDGCLGLKDQIAALTWVKENIENFGGDPDNVTLFGQSAGSISAMLLSIAPVAKGLFQKAIAQSGHLTQYNIYENSAKFAQSFLEFNGCKNVQEIVKKSAKELLSMYLKHYDADPHATESAYLPTCDGKFLPEHPLRALKDGAARDIKFMMGNTADEYRYWLLYYPELVEHMQEFHEQLLLNFYEGEFSQIEELYQSWQKNHTDIAADARYLEFADQLDWSVGQELTAEYQSAFNDVYFYLFSQRSPNPNLDLFSCHAIELPFVFDTRDKDLDANPNADLVKQVQAAWTSFAKNGNPNNALIPTWKKYSVDDRETMEINSKAWTCHKDFNAQNLSTLRHVYENTLLD